MHSLQVMNGIVSRRSWLLALATLSALLAVAALTLAPARAAPPDDLALTLSLIGDSDNVVPAGSDLQVAAKLSYTDASGSVVVTGGTLRVSGSHEWESNGRSSLGIQAAEEDAIAQTGWAVAVEERTSGGDIVIVGARSDIVDQNADAGSADLYIGGQFVKQLTAGDDVEPDANFGQGVDVAAGLIVIGAPGEGAVYIFDDQGSRIAKLTAGVATDTPVNGDANSSPISRFGDDVAIDDAGETIVVAAKTSKAQTNTATVFVFTKPASGEWADRSTDDNVPWFSASNRDQRYRFASPSGVDISADGNTIVWAFENPFKSLIAVHEKPLGGWANLHDGFVTLDTADDDEQLRPGETVAISDDGSTIAASGVTRYARDRWGTVGQADSTKVGILHDYGRAAPTCGSGAAIPGPHIPPTMRSSPTRPRSTVTCSATQWRSAATAKRSPSRTLGDRPTTTGPAMRTCSYGPRVAGPATPI